MNDPATGRPVMVQPDDIHTAANLVALLTAIARATGHTIPETVHWPLAHSLASALLATLGLAEPHAAAAVDIHPATGAGSTTPAPATATCAVCFATLVWRSHPDRDQAGWLHLPEGGEPR